jgi:hypothetical protein
MKGRLSVRRLGAGLPLLVVGLGCGGLIALCPDMAGAIIVLQLPGMLVWLFDPTPRRAIGRTLLLFQAAGSIRPIVSIWYQCEGLRDCVAMATSTRNVVVVMLFAACGLLLMQALPMLIKLFDDRRTAERRQKLNDEREQLAAEWELYR